MMKELKIPASAYLIVFVVPVVVAVLLGLIWLAVRIIPLWAIALCLGYCVYKVWTAGADAEFSDI